MIRRNLLLKQGTFFLEGGFAVCDVRITGTEISDIDTTLHSFKNDIVVPLHEKFVVPGLINCHDHLEFNLFPHLGHPPYKNYVDWSDDIQKQCQSEIRQVLQIPLKLRLLWGAYKNILSGVTTVIHHNPYYFQFRLNFPLDVFKNYNWIHSLMLEKRNLKQLLKHNGKKTFIHLAEGTDDASAAELSQLDQLGGLDENTVIIHGVGLRPQDIDVLEKAGAAVVWCPSSNQYLFGRSAPVKSFIHRVPVMLGTDSTLTGSLNLLHELQAAQKIGGFHPNDLLKMITQTPANVLKLKTGVIAPGAQADLLIYDPGNMDPFQSLVELDSAQIVCVYRRGRPIFGDLGHVQIMLERIPTHQQLRLNERKKFVSGNLPKLIRDISVRAPKLKFHSQYLPIVPQFS